MAQNVKFIKGDTAKINSTAIADGQLLYNTTTGQHYIDNESTRVEVGKPVDSALSTTSTNAIANKAITNSIINTMAEVSAITEPNIPCGTLAAKELNSILTTYSEITTGSGELGELYDGVFTVKKQFNIVTVSCTLTKSAGYTISPHEEVLYTISAGYRPASTLHIPCLFRNARGDIEWGYVQIANYGVVYTSYSPQSTVMNQVEFTASYAAFF